jgi:hypothetical protein
VARRGRETCGRCPRRPPRRGEAGAARDSPLRRPQVAPLAYAVFYSTAITIYFTCANDAARSGALAASAAALIVAVIGLGGLVGAEHRTAGRSFGVPVVGCGTSAWSAARSSCSPLGASRCRWSCCLRCCSGPASWSARPCWPSGPRRWSRTALTTGSPWPWWSERYLYRRPAAAGALIPVLGLPAMLVLTAIAAVGGAAAVTVVARPRAAVPRQQQRAQRHTRSQDWHDRAESPLSTSGDHR